MDFQELSRLIDPVTPEVFFAEYWEKKPLLIQRDDPNYYRELLDFRSVDECLTTLPNYHPDVSMADQNRELTSADYTYGTGFIDVVRLYEHFTKGSSITLNHLQDRMGSLASVCRALEYEMSVRTQANIYLTPPDGTCFPPHYDTHCVLVLQCEGAKHWYLHDVPLALPHHNQDFDPEAVEVGEVSESFELRPGDCLYIPRGVAHSASTEGLPEPALHATLGFLEKTWTDVLIESFAQVSLDDPLFRHALPIGFARPEFERDDARSHYAELLKAAVAKMDFDKVLDHFVDEIISTRHPILPGQLQQMMEIDQLDSVEHLVHRRPGVLYRYVRDEENQRFKIASYGSELSFPIHVETSVRYAVETPSYRISDIPGGLDDPGKLVLVKRLVRHGLVALQKA